MLCSFYFTMEFSGATARSVGNWSARTSDNPPICRWRRVPAPTAIRPRTGTRQRPARSLDRADCRAGDYGLPFDLFQMASTSFWPFDFEIYMGRLIEPAIDCPEAHLGSIFLRRKARCDFRTRCRMVA